jgi:hypothetical protein
MNLSKEMHILVWTYLYLNYCWICDDEETTHEEKHEEEKG